MSMPSDTAIYEGTLSDGRTADAMRAEVRFAERGLEIRPAGLTHAPLEWRYESLHSSVPLSADAPDVLLSLLPARTETLFVADPAFCRSLLKHAGGLSPTRRRLTGLRAGAAFVALVAAVVGAVWHFDYRPLQSLARVMPQGVRETMGRNVVASLTRYARVCETDPGRAALDRLTQRLLSAASDEPVPVQVVMVDWKLVNAFAAPGGRLILTRGLVEAAGSPDEVAGVLAHELGHTLELHPETGLIRAVALGLAADLVLAGAGSASNLGVLLVQMRYSREAEREADAHAVRVLKNAGISAQGFADFFQRLEPESATAATGGRSKASDAARSRLRTILSTHPVTGERVAMVRGQPPYPATPALSDADWGALRQMCAASQPARPTPPQGNRRGTSL